MKFYADKKIAQEEHRIYLHGIDLEDYELPEEYVMYEGDELPTGYMGLIKIKDNILSGATKYDVYSWGLCELSEGEVAIDNCIKLIPRPSYRHIWNNSKWIINNEDLNEGEYIENDSILTKEKPSVLYSWDKDSHEWVYSPELYELQAGEVLVNGEISQVPMPDGLLFPYWNRETNSWEDKTTPRELLSIKTKELIDNEIQLIAYERLGLNSDEITATKNKLQKEIAELKTRVETINVVGGKD